MRVDDFIRESLFLYWTIITVITVITIKFLLIGRHTFTFTTGLLNVTVILTLTPAHVSVINYYCMFVLSTSLSCSLTVCLSKKTH